MLSVIEAPSVYTGNMKIQLVYAPIRQSGKRGEFFINTWPPLGIMYLASYLKKKFPGKLKIKLLDGTLWGVEKTVEDVVRFAPDILGISAVTSNSTGGYDLAKKVKEKRPKTLIVFGGVHASALPEEVYQNSPTDLVAIGEGEQTLLEIVQTVSRKKSDFAKINGLALHKNNQVVKTPARQFIANLDNIPFPAYELLEHREKYFGWYFRKQSPETVIMTTRGCPFHCFFCTDVIWKSSRPYLRVRSPKNIVDELEILAKKYGIKEYFDGADEFNCSESWAISVCQEIIKRKLKFTWKCQLRADKVSDELAKNLAEAGCWYVHLGVESGNQKTLDGIGKKITLGQIKEACRTLKKYGLKVNLLLMLFNIWEKDGKLVYEDAAASLKTLEFAKHFLSQNLADFYGWSVTTPYPGTPLFRFCLRHNLIPQEMLGHWEKWNNIWSLTVNLPKVSRYDYNRVKLTGALWQSWYMFRKMGAGVNISSTSDLAGRALIIITLFLKMVKDRLFEKGTR